MKYSFSLDSWIFCVIQFYMKFFQLGFCHLNDFYIQISLVPQLIISPLGSENIIPPHLRRRKGPFRALLLFLVKQI